MRAAPLLLGALLAAGLISVSGGSGALLSASRRAPAALLFLGLIASAAAEDAKTADEIEAEAAGTLNHAALEKSKWQRAQPDGCKGGEGAEKSRWCYIHDDGSLTLRNAGRLQRNLDELVPTHQHPPHHNSVPMDAPETIRKQPASVAGGLSDVSQRRLLCLQKVRQTEIGSAYEKTAADVAALAVTTEKKTYS